MRPISSEKPSLTPNSTALRPVHRLAGWLYALWKFSRPHTVIGTTLSVVGVAAIAATPPSSLMAILPSVLWAVIACLGGNIYIVGLNQLEDVNIDRINKPHLPLASGEFSRTTGQRIVLLCGILAVAIALWQGPFLLVTIGLSLVIGTAYSLPPIRLKRFPVWASLCIFSVRGVIVNVGLFCHFHQQVAASPSLIFPSTLWALTLFILGFTFAIAIFKDIPDLEGDRLYHISTFTVQLGQRTVFQIARWVLTACYLSLIAAAFWLPVHTLFLVLTHGLALGALWLISVRVDLTHRAAIARYYQFIWVLFYLEYLLFPAACWLR